MYQWLRKLFGRKKHQENIEKLRADFKIHSHDFTLLLNANNRTLELMNEIEAALRGDRPFTMRFVHSRCSRIAANVFQIVRYLNELSPGKYESLFSQYADLQKKIVSCLSYGTRIYEGPMVMSLDELDRKQVERVGGKMANLGELKRELDIQIPDGFVVTTCGFWRFMNHDNLQNRIGKAVRSMETDEFDYLPDLSEVLTEIVLNASMPPDLEAAMMEAYGLFKKKAGDIPLAAVRSSALTEDLPGKSMAGQYHTELGVPQGGLVDAFKKVVASKYSYQSMLLMHRLGMRDEDVAMCVGVMPMVDARAGGVIYTSDPLDSTERDTTIYSVFGLPKAVVDGTAEVDRFVVSYHEPQEILKKEIAKKTQMVTCRTEGGCREESTGKQSSMPSLKDHQVIELASLARKIETYYESPQDIEWAMDDDGLFVILQSRPLARRRYEGRCVGAVSLEDDSVSPVLKGGVTASGGIGVGTVYVLDGDNTVLGCPDNAVLVAKQALPLWAVLLPKASAVITEGGSVAGHLASVARETGVPALLGIPNATKVLKDGQTVTVHADRRVVFEGTVGTPSVLPGPPISHIQDSPIYESLKKAAEHIIPLNLLDPDAREFSPTRCETIHDITRFCHEKAVNEMFNFGSLHHFPERVARQLYVDVPMQYWLIDLDDGFTEGAKEDGRFIRIEHVASTPMLAVWRGMTVMPWEGPPPVDAKGFLSVLYESTANTELLVSGPSSYSDRNYLMVTKNFVSLHSRFGYHFSSVESLLGTENEDNYLSFVFKGGAAALERRVLRAQLVAEVLVERGIRARCTEDSVTARMENCKRQVIETGLETIGYLIMHTRQLDMVMSSKSAVAKHKKKILEDLNSLR